MTNLAELDQDCNIPFEKTEKNYYMKVRTFSNGTVEAVTHAVRPIQMAALSAAHNGLGVGSGRFEKTPEELEEERLANHRRAVKRAKQTTRYLVKEMGADRMLTLTYRENMEDRERLYADFTRFIRLVRKSMCGADWHYVAVAERQQRGAWHIHLAVRSWQQISILRRCWYQALGGAGNETGESTPGAVNVRGPQSGRRLYRKWDSSKLAGYIVKYMEKTFEDLYGEKKRYWHSRGVKAPVADRVWLGAASNATDAITESISILKTFYGLKGAEFNMWLSPDWTCFWCSGRADP